MGNKIVIIGDLHLGARNSSSVFLKMMDKFFQEEFFPYIKKNNVKTVICLGDLLDIRKNCEFTISTYLKNTFYDFFRKNKIDFYSVLGNHDIYYKNSLEINGPTQFLDTNEKYIHIIDKPYELTINNKNFDLIPWVCTENKDDIVSWIDSHRNMNSILCGHFELAGFIMQKSRLSENGTIDIENLSGYRTILSGHYHTPSEKENIIYVGTPYELTWNDSGDEKKFMVYDTDTDEFDVIYTKVKMFRKIFFTDNILDSFNFDIYKRCYIKIIITDDYDEKKLMEFQSELEDKCSPIDVQLVDNRIIHIKDGLNEEIDITSFDVENPIDIMNSQIEKNFENNDELIKNCKHWLDEIYKNSIESMKVQI